MPLNIQQPLTSSQHIASCTGGATMRQLQPSEIAQIGGGFFPGVMPSSFYDFDLTIGVLVNQSLAGPWQNEYELFFAAEDPASM